MQRPRANSYDLKLSDKVVARRLGRRKSVLTGSCTAVKRSATRPQSATLTIDAS